LPAYWRAAICLIALSIPLCVTLIVWTSDPRTPYMKLGRRRPLFTLLCIDRLLRNSFYDCESPASRPDPSGRVEPAANGQTHATLEPPGIGIRFANGSSRAIRPFLPGLRPQVRSNEIRRRRSGGKTLSGKTEGPKRLARWQLNVYGVLTTMTSRLARTSAVRHGKTRRPAEREPFFYLMLMSCAIRGSSQSFVALFNNVAKSSKMTP
jgi:hypothetical protein